jgi:hypothetical protein
MPYFNLAKISESKIKDIHDYETKKSNPEKSLKRFKAAQVSSDNVRKISDYETNPNIKHNTNKFALTQSSFRHAKNIAEQEYKQPVIVWGNNIGKETENQNIKKLASQKPPKIWGMQWDK